MLRACRGGKAFRARRLAGRDSAATQLARRPARFQETRTPANVLRNQQRHGQHGEPLHRRKTPEKRRRFHAGQQGGFPPGLRDVHLRKDFKATLPRRAADDWRAGIEPAPRDALRLLERQAQTEHPVRYAGGPSRLRHGRKAPEGDGATLEKRRAVLEPAFHTANRILGAQGECAEEQPVGRPAARQLRRMPREQAEPDRELPQGGYRMQQVVPAPRIAGCRGTDCGNKPRIPAARIRRVRREL